ncbi:MAG: chemotaxis-specific protein-glutamate methyltransferase CheB [Sedimenticola sp.]
MKPALRILIIDDSRTVAMLLQALFDDEPDMEVVGIASDGAEGVSMARKLHPDVITMDIRMPTMDGFIATREIMSSSPIPIVVISSNIDQEELKITFRAIEEGALAVIEKPYGISHPDFEKARSRIVDTVRAMADVKVVRHRRFSPPTGHRGRRTIESHLKVHPFQVLVLAASTGGPKVLKTLLSQLPEVFPLPILVVQHIAKGFVEGMVAWLDQACALNVRIAKSMDRLHAGEVLFAKDDAHMVLRKRIDGSLYVDYIEGEKENYQRPSADPLFRSVAEACGRYALAGVFTGMGEDGAKGLLAIHQAGGETFAQDPASCIVPGMPERAMAEGAVGQMLTLEEVSLLLAEASAVSN